MARKPLVEAAPKYELYSEWLADEDNGLGVTYEVPADLLQIACRNYSAFQKSDVNRKANAARAAEREQEAPAPKSTKTTTKTKGKAKAKPVEDEDDDEPAPPKKTTPAKRAGKGGKTASF